MKTIYKQCEYCNGTGSQRTYDYIDKYSTTPGNLYYFQTCRWCGGSGMSDEILGYIQ